MGLISKIHTFPNYFSRISTPGGAEKFTSVFRLFPVIILPTGIQLKPGISTPEI
jgi:hypothetical protein